MPVLFEGVGVRVSGNRHPWKDLMTQRMTQREYAAHREHEHYWCCKDPDVHMKHVGDSERCADSRPEALAGLAGLVLQEIL